MGMSIMVKPEGWTLDDGWPVSGAGAGLVGVDMVAGVRLVYARRFRGGFPALRVTP